MLKKYLDSQVSKSIDRICPNKFHSYSDNHCAHFVSHALKMSFTYNCAEFKGGKGPAANIRVQEIFKQCPKVGNWKNVDLSKNLLVFVTKAKNVDLTHKKIINIPQKHVGILCNGFVYHYSNSAEKVVKWTPEKFLKVFQSIYKGNQGLFWGTIPQTDLNLQVDISGDSVSRGIAFALEKRGKYWFAQAQSGVNQKEFLVGKIVSNDKYQGLFLPVKQYYGHKFEPEKYTAKFDHWANLLALTAYGESKGYMNLINTYDRAKFTFGFYQLAAHTPNDNLILLFRQMMSMSKAKDYFPELKMLNGALHRVDEDGGYTNLETVMKTGPNGSRQIPLFMNYLNAKRWELDHQEILQSARIMHWCNNDAKFRQLQVSVSNDILQNKMKKRYHKWYNLEGISDTICGVIADIHHQGRAKKKTVRTALKSSNPLKSILRINDGKYKTRNRSVEKKLNEMIAAGTMGNKVYDPGSNNFVQGKPLF